ncbi:Rab family GTPase [Glaciecola sp. 1036]|uniref:Rab family GTPase n=1 Tax=Alteromonadaceae TaxID=72275 RepID=UPI003CFD5FB7
MLQKKICVLGPTGVGKTSLIKQFVEGIFSEKYLTSIGVKIDKKLLINGIRPVQLMIWDLEGIDKYSHFNPRYLRGASGLIFVADKSRFSSVSELMEIYSLTKKHLDVPSILAINKDDLPQSIKWDQSIVDSHAQSFDRIFTTSAKTGQSVEEMFEQIGKLITES